jgi:hypothetical protein
MLYAMRLRLSELESLASLPIFMVVNASVRKIDILLLENYIFRIELVRSFSFSSLYKHDESVTFGATKTKTR